MAQQGQTTLTGGRTYNIYDEQGVMRRLTAWPGGTLNHVGVGCYEATVANQNNLKATIYNSAGVILAETNIRVAGISGLGIANVAFVTIPFAGGINLPGGDIDILVASTVGSSTVVVNGQNGTAGTPKTMFHTYIFPDAPDPYTGFIDDTPTREWDIYLDYTPGAAAATLSAATPSGTLGTQTTATLGATTNQTTGNFYAVVDTGGNLTGVTASQIKAGQNASGVAAFKSGDVAVSTTTPSVGVTGLLASTSYAYAAIQNNANGDSNIVTGTFTTAAATAASGTSGGARARIATMMLT